MAYIGQSPSVGEFKKLDDISASFDNTTTSFNLTYNSQSVTPGLPTNLIISIDGVVQEPEVAYYLAGNQIVFTEAPNTNSSFFGVQLGGIGQVNLPSDNTISAAKIQPSAVTETKIADDAVTSAKIATDAVGDDQLASLSNVTITGGNISGANTFAQVLKTVAVTSSSNVIPINYANATVFTCTASENATITPSNFPAQQGIALLKLTNGGAYTISYAGNTAFVGNTAPTLTSAGTDFLYIVGNTTHFAVTTALDVY